MQCRIRDINVYYEIVGTGIPVVMIHGWSPDHRIMNGCMEPVFEKYSHSFKRIYFDLPGMGQTEGKEWIDGSDRMLDFIIDFIDYVIPGESFLLAGESYGGYLARGVIKRKFEYVDGLLLICPLADPLTQNENSPSLTVLEKDTQFINSLNEEEKRYFEGLAVVRNERVWKSFKKDILPGLKCANYDFLSNCLGRNVPYSFDIDLPDKPFDKPTLMLMGRQDNAVGYKDLWNILEAYPRASFVILDKSGHNLQIDQNMLFESLVNEWLDRVVLEKK